MKDLKKDLSKLQRKAKNMLIDADKVATEHNKKAHLYGNPMGIGENLVNDTLNIKLFKDGKLKLEVLEKLKEISNEFIKGLIENNIPVEVLDIHIIGSNASFNYNPYSDIDLHFLVNVEDITKEPDLLLKLYDFYKSHFNKKYTIEIYGIPVEAYLEDISRMATTSGRYSILHNDWIKEPVKKSITEVDITDLYEALKYKYQQLMVQPIEGDLNEFLSDLYEMRKISLYQDGEFGKGNLLFKRFRNDGYIKELKDYITNLKSQQLSLN